MQEKKILKINEKGQRGQAQQSPGRGGNIFKGFKQRHYKAIKKNHNNKLY